MERPLQRWHVDDILNEIRSAEREKRPADLTYKLLPEFSFFDKTIEASLDFEGSTIQGAIYFHNCKIKGDLIFKNVLIYTTLYLDKNTIEGDFVGEGLKLREVFNCIASHFKKNLSLKNAQIRGFLGLNRIFVANDLILDGLIVKNLKSRTGIIKGDIYLENAKIMGNVLIRRAFFEGLGNFKNTEIRGNLNLSGTMFQEIVELSGTIIEGETLTKDFRCENLIAKIEQI
ncbi:MAG: hypothetical protein LR000_00380 [Candidatus Pacebacteria bacterium]|nr:hypothetical protein [Candidatus Paceibacterota bacterium]